MATDNTKICNQSLGRLGSKRINNFEDADESSTEAIQCRLHLEPTRDALNRSHYWPFSAARADLSQDTTDPAFEWNNQFILPTDFLYLRSIWDSADIGALSLSDSRQSHAIEGRRILTNDSSMKIRYTRKVTDPTEFDVLFIEVLVLLMADKMNGPLTGGDADIQKKIDDALDRLMPKVRALSRQEANLMGRVDFFLWNDVRATIGGRTNFPFEAP